MSLLVILSPSKTLRESKEAITEFTLPALQKDAQKINQILRKISEKELAEIMGISPDLASLNYERNQNWELPFTPENSQLAIRTFQGDVYRGLRAVEWTQQELDFAQTHLRILSGLYGILRPKDLMQPYRLEMGTQFPSGEVKNLYQFWSSKLSQVLQKESKNKPSTLVNLASNEYFKAIDQKALQMEIITPTFKELKNGKYRTIAIFAKMARGMMARYLVKHRITEVEKLKNFREEGYQFNPELSTKNQWYFTRSM